MKIEILATVAVVTPDPSSSRELYVEMQGLPLEGHGDGYHHSEQIAGCGSFGYLAAVPRRSGLLRNGRMAGGAAGAARQH